MRLSALMASAALAATVATTAAQAAQLLVNGGFETGDFTGWTLGGNTGFTGVSGTFGGVAPEEGSFQMFGGAIGSDTVLTQSFADVAGSIYIATGWVYGFGGKPSDFTMSIGGSSIHLSPYPKLTWTQFTIPFVASGLDTLTILNRNDPNYQLLDNFQVNGLPVPEPMAWTMMLLGVGAVGFGLRRRRQDRTLAA